MAGDISKQTSGTSRPRSWKFAFLSLWGVWLVVTAGAAATIRGAGQPAAWNRIPYAIFNFFTPILLGNFDMKRPVIFLLLFGVLLLGDLAGRKMKWSALRMTYNLLVLAGVTAAIDLIVQGSWISLLELREALHL
jgi:hypothetical protein